MAHKGLLWSLDRDGQTEYCAIPFLPGIVEFQLMRAKSSPYEKKLVGMLDEFEEKMAAFTAFMTPEMLEQAQDLMPEPVFRVIPIQQEVKSASEIFPYEKVLELIEKEDFFAAAKCYCRHHAHIMDRDCKVENIPEYSCMSFGNVARFVVKYGFGKEITREEARETLNKCEEAGLVHCTNNVSDMMTFICNCCGCCCGIMRFVLKYQNPGIVSNANFILQANEEDCTGCEECLERCQVQALSMEDDLIRVDESTCIGCGLCVSSCPTECLQLVRREEIIEPSPARDAFIGNM